MFERFTDTARHVVVQAQHDARRLGHNYIGCEHLLLAAAAAAELVKSRSCRQDVYPDRAAPSYWLVFSYPFWWTDRPAVRPRLPRPDRLPGRRPRHCRAFHGN